MNMTSVQVSRKPFFGKYVLETTGNKWSGETSEEKKKRKLRLQEIFETIDDYVEQA